LEDNDDNEERRMFHIEIDQEIDTCRGDDGRWMAAIWILDGVVAHGDSREEAIIRVEAKARRFIRSLSC